MQNNYQIPEFFSHRYLLPPYAISIPDSPQSAALICPITKEHHSALRDIHFQVIFITEISQYVLQLVFGVGKKSQVISMFCNWCLVLARRARSSAYSSN
jgi:hypothetical protein